jgi:hypothetical protein
MKERLYKYLVNGTVIVTFIKKNGDLREMVCTLEDGVIPPIVGNSVEKEGYMTVWDLEKDAWRSFRLDSVIQIEAV